MLAKGKRVTNLNVKVATTPDYSIVGLTAPVASAVLAISRAQLSAAYCTFVEH